MDVKDRIIIALDVPDLEQAKPLIEQLLPYVGMFKVGLQLITAVGGPKVIEFVHNLGGSVFYDGKFDDIPNTIAGASKAVAGLNVKMFNVHASCGVASMQEAVRNSCQSLVLAVTVLTSLAEDEAHHIFGGPTKMKVLEFARDAKMAQVDGIICATQHLEFLNEQVGLRNLTKVVPGIRPKWAAVDDQEQVGTPSGAIKAGADYLVIGRPITQPPEGMTPAEAAQKIIAEIEAAEVEV